MDHLKMAEALHKQTEEILKPKVPKFEVKYMDLEITALSQCLADCFERNSHIDDRGLFAACKDVIEYWQKVKPHLKDID